MHDSIPRYSENPFLRIMRKTRLQDDGCLVMTDLGPQGYGKACSYKGKLNYPHRIIYEITFGLIPKGYEIHHVCENRACVTTSHLVAMPEREHKRHTAKRRAERYQEIGVCPNGHSLEGENRMERCDQPGKFRCRLCANAATQAHYARNKERWQKGGKYWKPYTPDSINSPS